MQTKTASLTQTHTRWYQLNLRGFKVEGLGGAVGLGVFVRWVHSNKLLRLVFEISWPWRQWARCPCEQRSRAALKWKVSSRAFLCRSSRSDSLRSLRSAPAGPESSSSTWRRAGMSELIDTQMSTRIQIWAKWRMAWMQIKWTCVANIAIFVSACEGFKLSQV